MRTVARRTGVALQTLWLVVALPSCGRDAATGVAEHGSEDPHAHESAKPQPGVLLLSEESRRLAEVTTQAAVVSEIHARTRATGEVQLDGRSVARVVSRVSGWVEEVRSIQGDRVARGDIILTIYSPEYQTVGDEMLRARERLDRAQASGDSAEIQTSSAIFGSARKRLLLLGEGEAEIDELIGAHAAGPIVHVHSPFDGTLIESSLVAGHDVAAGSEVCLIADMRTLWAILNVFEKDLASVRVGSAVSLHVGAYPDETFGGRVAFVDNVMDEATRTVKVRVEVQNPGRRLKPGMFVDGFIERDAARRALVIPTKAIQRARNEHFVFVTEADGFVRRDVEPGTVAGDLTEIVRGLAQGDSVVVGGAFLLKSELQKSGFEEGHAD